MAIVRLASGAALGLALAGCNMVVSDQPWFERNAASPVIKSGIWGAADKEDCTFDSSAPLSEWPECSEPAIIDAQGNFNSRDKTSGDWRSITAVVGGGDPMILQFALPQEMVSQAPGAPSYLYFALRPLARDADGRITDMRIWSVMCGPLAEGAEQSGDPKAMVTKQPFAGLTLKDGNCQAKDIPALTGAAARSEALQDKTGHGHWIRDARPEEMPAG
ncbi:MAG: hypothetical protein IE933_07240 [Sphingomonadales bacterium]|nr:hypothetical protein [Sphingomonadales bacterium]